MKQFPGTQMSLWIICYAVSNATWQSSRPMRADALTFQVSIPYTYDNRGTFYFHRLTSNLAWIINYIRFKVWDVITSALSNFNGATFEVW